MARPLLVEPSPPTPDNTAFLEGRRRRKLTDVLLTFAQHGVGVFALAEQTKDPVFKSHGHLDATTDADAIRHLVATSPRANWGLRPGPNSCIWDLDIKRDATGQIIKNGVVWAQRWCLAQTPPLDFEALTTTGLVVQTGGGGLQIHLRTPRPLKQGTNLLGKPGEPTGVDTRTHKGYGMAPGSKTPTGVYTFISNMAMLEAPKALCEAIGYAGDTAPTDTVETTPALPIEGIDQGRAATRATHYLQQDAPLAVDGAGGDTCTFKVAARIKDFGVSEDICFQLLADHWNDRCEPPWTEADLLAKVTHAYKYGQQPIGISAPEVEFAVPAPVVEGLTVFHPYVELNKEYAVAMVGGGLRIIREFTDEAGRFQCDHLSVADFRQWLATRTMTVGDKVKPLADLWLKSGERREYAGIEFRPGEQTSARTLNLWRGFSHTPAATHAMHPALALWLEHSERNICQGDRAQLDWLLSFAAHLIQKPSQKPLVALVLIGAKGVGKNAWLDHLGALLGPHFMVTANRRYLTSNFNAHLERCLLLGLDEAFWSGDKQVEGILKDLITGREHLIERKGHETYTVANKTRVVILGNESWVVPASHDERRFAVFSVGEGRKQDRAFFRAMQEGMHRGGYEALLRFLLDYDLDLAGVDINAAPQTVGLRTQQDQSLYPLPEWWLACLLDGRMVGATSEGWPTEMTCEEFRLAFRRHCLERNIAGRMPSDDSIGRYLKSFAPSMRKRQLSSAGRPRAYDIPPLDQLRGEWDAYMPPGRSW